MQLPLRKKAYLFIRYLLMNIVFGCTVSVSKFKIYKNIRRQQRRKINVYHSNGRLAMKIRISTSRCKMIERMFIICPASYFHVFPPLTRLAMTGIIIDINLDSKK